MEDIRAFRNAMAEKGTEYTPKEAKKAMDAAFKFQTEMDRKFIEDPQYFENLRKLTLADKQRLCREFLELGREVTPNEIDGLVELILSTQDKLDNWQ
jgi:hypothetical protein